MRTLSVFRGDGMQLTPSQPVGGPLVEPNRKVSEMLRKCLTSVAVMAAVFAGTAGVANASTPAPTTKPVTCTAQILSNCIGTGTNLGGLFGGGHRGGRGGFGGPFRGGIGGFRGGNFGGTFWQRDGVILPYAQAASSCGCSGAPVGWTQVVDPAALEVVPFYGAPVTGDGSCLPLTAVNWGLPGWSRGVRLYHRH